MTAQCRSCHAAVLCYMMNAARSIPTYAGALRRVLVKEPMPDWLAEALDTVAGTHRFWANLEANYRQGRAAGKTDTTGEVPDVG